MNLMKDYIVIEPGNGDVIVSEVSGTVTDLEDDICRVYGGNDCNHDRALGDAARIAALLNLAQGISTEELVNGTSILLNTSAALGEHEMSACMAYASGLHEMQGFQMAASRGWNY